MEEETGIPVIQLNDTELLAAWSIEKDGKEYIVHGDKIEKFARRTEVTNVHAMNRLRDIMRKIGITHELIRQGAKSTSPIHIGKLTLTLVEQ